MATFVIYVLWNIPVYFAVTALAKVSWSVQLDRSDAKQHNASTHITRGSCLFSTQVIDDPAGNSFIENELAPNVDPQLDVEHYVRSEQQDKEIGASIATQVNALCTELFVACTFACTFVATVWLTRNLNACP